MLEELGRKEEAEDACRALLEQNPDNLEYYRQFLRNRGLDITGELDDASREKVLKALDQFSETYPKSSAPRRLALDVATGPTFDKLAQDYLVRGLERGVPSLFVDVKGVYRDSAKMAAIGTLMTDIIAKVKAGESLHDDETIAAPTTLLWAYYFLALHITHPLQPSPDCARALELLDSALEHTPTLPEIYMAKAKVLKRAGDVQAAAEAMEDARLLDGQDRFLNGKAGKYWLRAGHIAKAEELLGMFTKVAYIRISLTPERRLRGAGPHRHAMSVVLARRGRRAQAQRVARDGAQALPVAGDGIPGVRGRPV